MKLLKYRSTNFHSVNDFVEIEKSEIEDLILSEDIVKAVDRIMPRNVEEYFSDIFEKGKPIFLKLNFIQIQTNMIFQMDGRLN